MVLLEWKRVIRDSSVIVLVLLLISAALLLTDRDAYLAPAFEIFLLLYSSFMGWSMFERERQEGAMEFYLGLPIGRYKLLLFKFLPRFWAVLLLLAYYWGARTWFSFPFILTETQFTISYGALFFISFGFSLLINSFLGSFFLAASLFAGLSYFIKYMEYSLTNAMAMLQAGLWLLALPAVFLALYRTLDIKPISFFHKKLAPAMLATTLLVFGVNYLVTGSDWWNYYLTADGSLMKASADQTVIERTGSQTQSIAGRMSPLMETETFILATKRGDGQRYPGQMVRFEINSGDTETIFSAQKGWWFHEGPTGKLGATAGGNYYFLLTNNDHIAYKIVELDGYKSHVVPLNIEMKKTERFHRVYHAIADPLQLFLFSGQAVYRVSADGKTVRLWEADDVEAWGNRVMVFKDGRATLYQIDNGMPVVIWETGDNARKLRCRFGRCGHRNVLFKIENQAYIMDLETLAKETIQLRSTPYYYLDTPEGVRVVWVSGSEITVGEYKQGHMTVESVWYTQLDGFRLFQVFKSGIVVYNRNRHEVFRYVEEEGSSQQSPESSRTISN
jgi:hypothetical protein